MTFDRMIVAWDMLGLIGDYCGKIQLNSDKVRQSYIIKTKMKQSFFKNVISLMLRGYCTPDQFCDCLFIFPKNYNTLVTSKICFLLVTFQGT